MIERGCTASHGCVTNFQENRRLASRSIQASNGRSPLLAVASAVMTGTWYRNPPARAGAGSQYWLASSWFGEQQESRCKAESMRRLGVARVPFWCALALFGAAFATLMPCALAADAFTFTQVWTGKKKTPGTPYMRVLTPGRHRTTSAPKIWQPSISATGRTTPTPRDLPRLPSSVCSLAPSYAQLCTPMASSARHGGRGLW